MSMPVTLENCDREPIHIPGLIQPHGALLAFDREGNLVFSSSNAAELLGLVAPRSGPLEALGLEPTVVSLIQSWRVDSAKNFACFGVAVNGRNLDIIGNRNDNDLLIVEFEMVDQMRTADESSFPTLVHRAMERFKRQTDINELLGMVATEVRKITGFDRVMAYRFRHDDSGEVVRESRRDDLDSWEGHRYPSSDIPAQARRLYVVNTLRLVADVSAAPVPIVPLSHGLTDALDMSFCVLRSVSPIHIEYLTNMSVAASLSISIVINGRLWGMIACHHGEPRHVPHGARMLCEVIGQMVAITISSLQAAEVAAKLSVSTHALAEIGVRARSADDLLTGISAGMPSPANLIQAEERCVCGAVALLKRADSWRRRPSPNWQDCLAALTMRSSRRSESPRNLLRSRTLSHRIAESWLFASTPVAGDGWSGSVQSRSKESDGPVSP